MGMATSKVCCLGLASYSRARACRMGWAPTLVWLHPHFSFWSCQGRGIWPTYCPSSPVWSDYCKSISRFWNSLGSELKRLALIQSWSRSNISCPWVSVQVSRLGWKRRSWSGNNRRLGQLTVIEELWKVENLQPGRDRKGKRPWSCGSQHSCQSKGSGGPSLVHRFYR